MYKAHFLWTTWYVSLLSLQTHNSVLKIYCILFILKQFLSITAVIPSFHFPLLIQFLLLHRACFLTVCLRDCDSIVANANLCISYSCMFFLLNTELQT